MVCDNPGCLGEYNFENIANYARKRFVEGFSTIALLEQAKSDREKEEIALVCMLDVEDDIVLQLKLRCRYDQECELTNCRDKLRQLIEHELALQKR